MNAQDFGCVGDGVTDDTAAFSSFVAAINTVPYAQAYMPGHYKLTSQLPSITSVGIRLFGYGKISSGFIAAYNRSTNAGIITLAPGAHGFMCQDLFFNSPSGNTGGCCISAIADSSQAMNRMMFERLTMSADGNNNFDNMLYLDGTALTTGAIGIRATCINDCDIFGCNGYSAVFKGCEGLSIQGGGFYPAAGTNVKSGAIQIGGTSSVKSQYININITTCNGLDFSQCLNGNIESPVIGYDGTYSITNASTASQIRVHGLPSGSVQANWINSSQSW